MRALAPEETQGGIVEAHALATALPITDVVNQGRARIVAAHAQNEAAIGTGDGFGRHGSRPRASGGRRRECAEIRKERDPRFGGGGSGAPIRTSTLRSFGNHRWNGREWLVARPRRLERHAPVQLTVGTTVKLWRAAEVEIRIAEEGLTRLGTRGARTSSALVLVTFCAHAG